MKSYDDMHSFVRIIKSILLVFPVTWIGHLNGNNKMLCHRMNVARHAETYVVGFTVYYTSRPFNTDIVVIEEHA